MVFSDTSTNLGIIQDIDFTCGTTSAQYPTADKVRNVNNGLDEVADLIQKASGDWNWEDTNNSDLPIGTTDLVSGQQDYSIDTSFLSILGVYIKDSSGLFTEITPIDRKIIIEKDTTQTGTPTNYYLNGNSIYLYPIPDSTVSGTSNAGLKIHCQRNVSYFTASDTTKTPGFNPQFHKLLSLYASRDYAVSKGKDNLNVILSRIEKMEKALKESYSRRNKTVNTSLKTSLNTNNYI